MYSRATRTSEADKRRPFLFSVTVKDGMNEYLFYHVVNAESEENADELARSLASAILGSEMIWNEESGFFESTIEGEHRVVEYHGIIGEATMDLVIGRLSLTTVDMV